MVFPTLLRNPRLDWTGSIENYGLDNYPDYEAGKPPRVERLQKISYLEEVERIWGAKWRQGAQGIGKLRHVGLIKPSDHEGNILWTKDPDFFLLRRGIIKKEEVQPLIEQHEEFAKTLKDNGVTVDWMEIDNPMGAYGPMRKLWMAEEATVIKGGAILPRFGHASYKRGLEPFFLKFLVKVGCPILFMVHGDGIYEPCPGIVFLADDAMLGHKSCGGNEEGIRQIVPVLERAGVREMHFASLPTIMDTFESGGEFHVDVVAGPVDLGVAVVFPASLPFETYMWLKDRNFRLIEIPLDEHRKCMPANNVLLEPAKVIMPAEAKKVNSALRKEGFDVVEVETSMLTKGGVNGIKCMVLFLERDLGPSLSEIYPQGKK
jgi:N-dimethylarginine dimethylaminohydrolase